MIKNPRIGLPVSLIDADGDDIYDQPQIYLEGWNSDDGHCMWFDQNGFLHRADFKLAMLKDLTAEGDD